MSFAADLTAYVAAAVAVLGSGGSYLVWRKKNKDEQDMTEVVSFESLNKALNTEVNRVNQQLAQQKADYEQRIEAMETRHREQLKSLELDYEQRHATLRSRVSDLETDNASLNRQLMQARGWGEPRG